MVQLAAFGGPSGMSDMKKVIMNDHVEDRKPVWGALFGSSAPSSALSPSSSEPSSITPSYRMDRRIMSNYKNTVEYMSH